MGYTSFFAGGNNISTKAQPTSGGGNTGADGKGGYSSYFGFNVPKAPSTQQLQQIRQQQAAQAMQQQVQQKAAPQHQTLLNRVQGVATALGHAGQAVARPITDIGGAIGQEIQNKPVTNAGKFVHDTAQLSSDVTGGTLNQFAKGVAQAPGAVAGEIASQSKNPYVRAQGVQAVQGAQKKAFGTNDSGTIAKKIAASTVGTASLFAGGGELAGAKTLLKAGAKVAGKQVAKDAAIGATGNAAATVTQNPNATAKDIGKSAAVGGLLGAVAPHAIKGAGDVGRVVAEKTGIADHPVTNTLLGSVKQGHQDLLNAKANALLTKARSLDPQAPAAAPVEPAPHVTYEPGNSKVKTLIDSSQKQQQAAEAPMKAAQAEQDKAAASAEQAQAQGQKIDRQIELLQAKAKDSENGLSNVDQTKLQHLQQDKVTLPNIENNGKVSVNSTKAALVATPAEPVAKPVSESPNAAAPTKAETAPGAVAKQSSANNTRPDNVINVDGKEHALSGQALEQYKAAKAEHDRVVETWASDKSSQGEAARKGAGMKLSAAKRQITGSLTGHEQQTIINRERKPYVGKEVTATHNGKTITGTVASTPTFGRVKLTLPDGQSVSVEHTNIHADNRGVKEILAPHTQKEGVQPYKPEAKPAKVEAPPTNTKTNETPQTKESSATQPTAVHQESVTEQPASKVSGSALKSEQKAVQAGLAKSLGDKAQYDTGSYKVEAANAVKLTHDNPEEAKAIAMGQKPGNNTIHEVAVRHAVEQQAIKEKDIQTLLDLSKSTQHTATSEAAQRLGTEGYHAEPTSPVDAIRQVRQARQAAFEKRSGKTADKAINDEVKAIRQAVPKTTVRPADWNSFLERIKC